MLWFILNIICIQYTCKYVRQNSSNPSRPSEDILMRYGNFMKGLAREMFPKYWNEGLNSWNALVWNFWCWIPSGSHLGLIINALRMHIFILVDHLACIIAVWTIEHCAKYISATHIMFNIYPPSYLWAIYNVFYNHHSVIMLFLYFTTYQYIMEMYLQK